MDHMFSSSIYSLHSQTHLLLRRSQKPYYLSVTLLLSIIYVFISRNSSGKLLPIAWVFDHYLFMQRAKWRKKKIILIKNMLWNIQWSLLCILAFINFAENIPFLCSLWRWRNISVHSVSTWLTKKKIPSKSNWNSSFHRMKF